MYNIFKILGVPTAPSSGRRSSLGIDQVDAGAGSDNLLPTITSIINGVIGILGFVCVVVMIIGGVNYMTSAGDSGKVTKAKNTILYGLIGLVICVLSFAIVNFLISNIIGGGS